MILAAAASPLCDVPLRAAGPRRAALDGEQKLRLVFDAAGDPGRFAELSERHGIPEAQLHEWRPIARPAAARALAADDNA